MAWPNPGKQRDQQWISCYHIEKPGRGEPEDYLKEYHRFTAACERNAITSSITCSIFLLISDSAYVLSTNCRAFRANRCRSDFPRSNRTTASANASAVSP